MKRGSAAWVAWAWGWDAWKLKLVCISLLFLYDLNCTYLSHDCNILLRDHHLSALWLPRHKLLALLAPLGSCLGSKAEDSIHVEVQPHSLSFSAMGGPLGADKLFCDKTGIPKFLINNEMTLYETSNILCHLVFKIYSPVGIHQALTLDFLCVPT